MYATKINAHQVWEAVIAGNNTSPQIAAALGVSRSHAAVYLRVMTEVGLLTATTEPLTHPLRWGSAQGYVYKPDYDTAQALGW